MHVRIVEPVPLPVAGIARQGGVVPATQHARVQLRPAVRPHDAPPPPPRTETA
jgi:hypothetical protein